MARVKKEYKLKSISSKNIEELYEEYQKEFTRVVSKNYKKFGKQSVYETFEQSFEMLNKEQFKTEIDIAKQQKIYGKRLASYTRNLVHREVKYSMKQNNAILHNLNNIIKKEWSKAAGRSTKGRQSTSITFDTSTMDEQEFGLLQIMDEYKGSNKNYTEYLLDLSDVVGQSMYFRAIYDYVMTNLATADEVYES